MMHPFELLQMSGITDADFIQGQIAEKVAANPGKLVQKMAAIESTSPLIYFDEIEKIGQECVQTLFDVFDDNPHVHDRFLDFSVDLSSAQLICSANDVTQIHPALLNRMKIIRCSGYSAYEKQVIAREFLIKCLFLGVVFLILGIIGLMIPVIPQVPFLIVSLLFFAGCIPGLRRWLVNTKFFKKYILPHVRKDKYLQEILLEVK